MTLAACTSRSTGNAGVRWKPMVARRPPKEAIQKLSAEDLAWLEQRIREYRRLLDYLRDH